MAKIKTPECAGWHEPSVECDGDDVMPPCLYRERCLVRIRLIGGREKRTVKVVRANIAEYSEAAIDELMAPPPLPPDPTPATALATRDDTPRRRRRRTPPSAPETSAPAAPTAPPPPPPAPKLDPAPRTRRKGKRGPAVAPPAPKPPVSPPEPVEPLSAPTQDEVAAFPREALPPCDKGPVKSARNVSPPPYDKFAHVLPVLAAFVDRFARDTGKRHLPEAHPDLRPGDLFVRFTPGMGGRVASLYEATDRGKRTHRLIARVVMHRRTPTFAVKTNIPEDKYENAVAMRPPTGPECLVWRDMKNVVALVGVAESTARDSARWLARCYHAGLVDHMRGVAPKNPTPECV